MTQRIAVISLIMCACSIARAQTVTTGTHAYVIRAPRPEYPFEARSRHYQGSGVFVCRIEIKTGRVKRVIMVKSTGVPMLDNEAIKAFEQWRFQPGKLQPISKIVPGSTDPLRDQDSYAKIPITFSMDPNAPFRKH